MGFFTRSRGAGYYLQQAKDYYDIGFQKLQRGDFHAAISNFNIAIQNNMRYENAYIMRGFAKVGLREVYSAVDDFTMAISINQNSLPAYALRGMILSETTGETVDLRRVLDIVPQTGMDYWARGSAKVALATNEDQYNSGVNDQLKAMEMGFRIRLN